MASLPILGELETAVLGHLWTRGSGDAKGVHVALGAERGITVNTIQSTLERLFRKQLLKRCRTGHAYLYTPAISRDAFRASAVAAVAGELRGATGAGVLAAFVDVATSADPRNLDRLEKLVARARAKREGR